MIERYREILDRLLANDEITNLEYVKAMNEVNDGKCPDVVTEYLNRAWTGGGYLYF